MDEATFWKLIELVDIGALQRQNQDAAVQPLTEALTKLDEASVFEFENILVQMLYDIDGQKYADEAGRSGNSDDGFLYIRCFVVAMGREYYNAVKADPRRMPKDEAWCESLTYVAGQAWTTITGKDEEDWYELATGTSVSYESGSNKANWQK